MVDGSKQPKLLAGMPRVVATTAAPRRQLLAEFGSVLF